MKLNWGYKMEYTNMQQVIYDTYNRTGIVIAECPRQSGKTTIMKKIIVDAIAEGKSVGLFTLNASHYKVLYKELKLTTGCARNDIRWRNSDADVLCYDEIFKDPNEINHHQRLVCLRTPRYPVLRFTYKDVNMGCFDKENMDKLKIQMGDEKWAVEYNGGKLE